MRLLIGLLLILTSCTKPNPLQKELNSCYSELEFWKNAAKLLATPPNPYYASTHQGEKLYKTNCALCHGAQGQGAIGPDIRYSSLELLKLKVTEGRYPEGYTPQRNTNNMPKFPHLHEALPDIYEYLKSKRKE